MTDLLFSPGSIGSLSVGTRVVRSAVSESMATREGFVKDELVDLYETLARNGVTLMFAGQMFVEERGRAGFMQTGIHDPSMVAGLSRLPVAVHRHGGRIFAQLAHAGAQSLADGPLIAPSDGMNWITGQPVAASPDADVREVVDAFGRAAALAVEAGYDGVHVHAANGYLLSTFQSPLSNTRDDAWGGSASARGALTVAIVERIRASVPAGFPVTVKLGLADEMDDGLRLEESLDRAERLVAAGVSAFEVSSNLADGYDFSCRPYVGVTRRQAFDDILVHRLWKTGPSEAYFRTWAGELRKRVPVAVIVTGGMRRRAVMESVLAAGQADFVGVGRPFIREPGLMAHLRDEGGRPANCTSCNICVMHDEHHGLRCWRMPRRNLAEHAAYRLSGGLKTT